MEEAMRTRHASVLLAGVCALALGPALGAETDAAKPGPGGSNVTLSGSGPVQQPGGKPALQLNEAQQLAIRDEVLRRESHQATPHDFKPEVGGKVPSTINIHGLPQSLLEQIPALKEYTYAHLDRTILLADSLENRIVLVMPVPDNLVQASTGGAAQKEAAVQAVGGLSDLKPDQLRSIYQAANGPPQPVPQGAPMMAGASVPAAVTLAPLPGEVGTQLPQAQGWQFAKLQDGRMLLVDGQRTVVGVITQEEGARTADGGGKPGNTGVAKDTKSPDPLHAREQSGRDSAYTGPKSLGQNTDAPK
jgi:hypothetical protein